MPGLGSVFRFTVDEVTVDILPEPGESAGGRVLRYLRTLTAWHGAARAAIQFLCKARKVPQVSLVKLSDHSPAVLEDIRRNGQAVVDSLQRQIASKYANNPHTMKAVSDWVQDYCRIPEATGDKSGRHFRVHPEAGLMALLMAGKTKSEGIPDNVYALATVCDIHYSYPRNSSFFLLLCADGGVRYWREHEVLLHVPLAQGVHV